MAKIFNGKVLFASAMQPTGAQPLDDRVVVQSYSDLVDATTFGDAKYLGMVVGVVDESKIYMLTNTDVTAEGAWKEIGAGGAVSVNTYAEAVALASDENIGQVIYVKTKSSYDADGEGDGAAVEYDAAPYIVIGAGSLQKLAASTASGDIEGDVAELKTKVSGIETTVGNAEGGLVKDVADLKSAVDALPETFVTDVKDASGNSVVVEGVVTLGDYATKTEVNNGLALKVNSSDYSDKMAQVDASIAEKADASALDGKVDKAEGFSLVDDTLITKLGNIVEIKSIGGDLNLSDAGELTVTVPEVEVPEYNVVKLGTAEDGYAASYQLQKDGSAIGATINIPKDMVVSKGEVVENPEGHDAGLYIVLTLANATNDKLYIPANKLVDDYTGSTYVEVASNGEISIKYNDLKSALQADFDNVYDASGAAAAVDAKLAGYKTTNDAAVAAKVDSSDYTAKVTEIDGSISAIKASIANVYTKAEVDASLDLKANVADVYTKTEADSSVANAISVAIAPLAVKADVDASLDLKANVADVYTKTEADSSVANAISVAIAPLAVKANVDTSLAGKVDKVDGKGLSTNDFTNELKTKLEGVEAGAEVNYVKSVGANLAVDGAGNLTVDLSALATSEALTNGLAAKLDASAKVNGVSFVNGEATLDAGDIALETAIVRTENGQEKHVYEATSSIQSVLAGLSARIDTLDPNISGEFGVSAITAGNGIEVSGASSTPTISVKASTVEGNIAEVKTDGIYVAAPEVPDMRSYWEAI